MLTIVKHNDSLVMFCYEMLIHDDFWAIRSSFVFFS